MTLQKGKTKVIESPQKKNTNIGIIMKIGSKGLVRTISDSDIVFQRNICRMLKRKILEVLLMKF